MSYEKVWSRCDKPAIVVTSLPKAISHTVLGAMPSVDVVNVTMRKPGNLKKEK